MSADANTELGPIEIRHVTSDSAGVEFAVHTARCGIEPTAVLVLTDADAMFSMAVDLVRMMQLPGLIGDIWVVGVGYPGGRGFQDTMFDRMRDLTPTPSEWGGGSGGGPSFLEFIASELLPLVREQCGAAAEDLTYFGHSLGGLFGTYAFLERPDLFGTWILSSPSLWWDHRWIFARERDVEATSSRRAARLFFGIGGDETDDGRRREAAHLPDDHMMKPPPTYLDMVDDMERFVAGLAGRNEPGLEIESAVFDDEFHATVAPVVLSRGLRRFPPRR